MDPPVDLFIHLNNHAVYIKFMKDKVSYHIIS